ncbi:MAG: hypothetical protein HC877_19445 [Thioploca sp.]|nr:hypothetical protein [Thioploca sp.]
MDTSLFKAITSWFSRQVSSNDMNIQLIESIGCALGTTLGKVRSENQDRAIFVHYSSNLPMQSFLLFALCDGMGGMRDGGICANITLVEMIHNLINNRVETQPLQELLELAVKVANEKVFMQYHEQGGTTLSAVALDNTAIVGINVGDSRIYQYDNYSLNQISLDDTLEARTKIKNEFSKNLIQYIGMGKDLVPNLLNLSLENGLLLTSDGIHNIGNDFLKEIIKNAFSASDAVKKLIYLSSWLGGKDNASLIFLPKESISLLQNLLNEVTTGRFVEIWDCFSSRQILLPDLTKKKAPKKPSKTAIATKGIGDKDLSIIPSESRENRSAEKPKLNIEIGKK